MYLSSVFETCYLRCFASCHSFVSNIWTDLLTVFVISCVGMFESYFFTNTKNRSQIDKSRLL
jgi:hypothetical protein